MNTLEEFLHFRRRAKEWSPEYERLMLYLVRLCVDQRESRCVREGLFSFRSITTNVGEPEPLRKAIKLWHDLTLAKVAEARSLCSSAEAPVRDLDAERVRGDLRGKGKRKGGRMSEEGREGEGRETSSSSSFSSSSSSPSCSSWSGAQSPEETIMSAVSEAGESERRERDVLIPWVRYACDTIKQALSLLRADNKVVEGMETLYHEIAVRSFRFLREIGRTNEFRQLSKTLREHLEDLLRDPPRGETPDAQARLQDAFVRALEAHLQTRFSQLDHCDELGIWAEALRVAEDMERILFHPEFERKHTNLASYYDRLARIFLASENPLLHACAFFQHVLNVPRGPVADRRRLATTTVLAALSAPVFSEDVVDGDDAPRTRRSRLVDMLHITWTPSRATLLAETEAHGYLAFADPEVQALHNLLEKKFEPLRLIEEAQPLLAWVQTAYDGQLARYAKAVQRLLVLRLVSQLSSVYTTVRLSKFFTMVESLSLGPYEIEREIVSAVRARHLRVRIDHKNDSLHLGDDSFESSESMRRQLAHLANRLRHVVALLAQSGTPEAAAADPTIAEAARRRADTFAAARASIGPLHDGMLRRVAFIEADREEEERRRIKERQEVRWPQLHSRSKRTSEGARSVSVSVGGLRGLGERGRRRRRPTHTQPEPPTTLWIDWGGRKAAAATSRYASTTHCFLIKEWGGSFGSASSLQEQTRRMVLFEGAEGGRETLFSSSLLIVGFHTVFDPPRARLPAYAKPHLPKFPRERRVRGPRSPVRLGHPRSSLFSILYSQFSGLGSSCSGTRSHRRRSAARRRQRSGTSVGWSCWRRSAASARRRSRRSWSARSSRSRSRP